MDLILTDRADSVWGRISGDLDISTSPCLRRRLVAALEPPRVGLVLDLSEVTFMDASALGALMAARQRSLTIGGDGIRLSAPSRPVLRLLNAAGLQDRFPPIIIPAQRAAAEPAT
ncbi:anti-sigma factor antagonist [Sphaerisporangium rufum]|uniref:Anti-sigma factor antagonist n=1 Tax=Sphaerisporangium rufum TaxID=1381558 RepID=A0A919QXA7_9ACTN|nr:STAS domain-containing protein [Sphaerisporangium rufum]GII75799.1 anti-sigma factor antagonist [Sphaerisporangium rufum]